MFVCYDCHLLMCCHTDRHQIALDFPKPIFSGIGPPFMVHFCSLAMANNDQSNLSECLQLLHELGYSDLDMPYQASGIHSNKRSQELDTNRDTVDILIMHSVRSGPRVMHYEIYA
jgi:hypothetical protein